MDLSLRDAAKILDVSESKLSKWISEEGLPAFMINGRYRFNRVDLLEWATHRHIPAAALYLPPEARGTPYRLETLLEGNIHHAVPGADKKSVMAAVADLLPLGPRDKALAAQALWDHETKGSTVLDGVAIPHARSPLIFSVDRPVATLCFLKSPVSFEAAGAAPVRVVWTLVTPTVRAHLAILARVAAALHDAELRGLLDRAAPAPEILARLKGIA